MALVKQPTLMQRLMALPPDVRAEVLRGLKPETARALRYAWRDLWARPEQLAPGSLGADPALRGRPGLLDLIRARTPPPLEYSDDWSTWCVLGGRGGGKTHVGAAWVIEEVKKGRQPPIALMAATSGDLHKVMICEDPQPGQSGIIAISEPGFRPRWIGGKQPRLVWPNGVIAYGYSAEEPERLRGPQHGKAWADDAAAWHRLRVQAAWDMLQFGMRLGQKPQTVVTTTPKAIPWLVGARTGAPLGLLNDPTVMISRIRTATNRANLAESFIRQVVAKYEGTRLGRQELEAEILADVEGALWSIAMIDAGRVASIERKDLRRIVVAIDPMASAGTDKTDEPEKPETGIVIAGLGMCDCQVRPGSKEKPELHAFVLEDPSGSFSPNTWGKKAVEGYRRWKADRIIGEQNNGGVMVENTVRTVDPKASYKAVHASRGKRTRAEPVAALYEQGKVHHVGKELARLEDQLTMWDGSGPSPNRLDALVWALTDLMIEGGDNSARAWLGFQG